jgi:acetylornithine deacetylase/succinyl-diaminopimelate desuccinylase-like protein
MKGALACYVEAVRALQDQGVRLRGDILLAAVCGEIEKTQQCDAQGAEFRGYAAGSRYLVGHGGAADMCILGEPTENKLVLAHFGSLWLRLSTHGPFVHTAFSEGRRGENSILRMRPVLDAVLEWLPRWEERMSYGDVRGVANVGGIEGGFGWRASRTPHRTDLFLDLRVPPDVPMADARREALEFARRQTASRRRLRTRLARRSRRVTRSSRLWRRLMVRCLAWAPERDVTLVRRVRARATGRDGQLRTSSGAAGRGSARTRDRRLVQTAEATRAPRCACVGRRPKTFTPCRLTCRCPRTTVLPTTRRLMPQLTLEPSGPVSPASSA